MILTEAFLDPIIDKLDYNYYISLLAKVGIALLLRPIDSAAESILLRRKLKEQKINNKY